MPAHDYPYKNLVFEGGGVKGVAYGGVFEVLEQTKSRRRLNQR
jgi:NTE family protein